MRMGRIGGGRISELLLLLDVCSLMGAASVPVPAAAITRKPTRRELADGVSLCRCIGAHALLSS
jgi:hypothetical protein